MLTNKQIKKIKVKKSDSQLPLIFEALGDQGRFHTFKLLTERRGLCVTEIARVFNITTSAASQQLKILERAGLVQRMRMGLMIWYQVNLKTPRTKQLIKLFEGSGKKIK
jgi:DNA-binding transcriptional ArsR family regulator